MSTLENEKEMQDDMVIKQEIDKTMDGKEDCEEDGIKKQHATKIHTKDTEVIGGLELSVECASDKDESSSTNENEKDIKPRVKTIIVKAEPNESELDCSSNEDKSDSQQALIDTSEIKSEKKKTKRKSSRTSFSKLKLSGSEDSQNSNSDEDYSPRTTKKMKRSPPATRKSTNKHHSKRGRVKGTKGNSYKKSSEHVSDEDEDVNVVEQTDKSTETKNGIEKELSEKESSKDESDSNSKSEEKSMKDQESRYSYVIVNSAISAKRGNWTQAVLNKALNAVQNKLMSERKASQQFGIPRRTLRRYIANNEVVKAKLGRKFTLSTKQNADLCSRIERLAATGYPITTIVLRLCVYKYCMQNKLRHQFSNIKQIASHKWVHSFLKVNPTIFLRKSHTLNQARAEKLNKFIVEDHFKNLQVVLEKNNLIKKPQRIFNMDEKSCQLNLHKKPKVLAQKRVKRIHIVGNEHSENVTVVACVNALGAAIPPMIIVKGKRKKLEYADDLPSGSTCCMAEQSSMTSKTFVFWLHHFAKYKPAGPCLVIFDGAKSHLDFEIVDVAKQNDILLYCLPSNIPHELQPLDKSVFRSFEHYWDQEVQMYGLQKDNTIVTEQRFGQIFSKVWDKCTISSNIKAGFKACGIFPFDPYIIPETAFAPNTVTEMSASQTSDPLAISTSDPLATSTSATFQTTAVPVTIIEKRSSSEESGPSYSTMRPDTHILFDGNEDAVFTSILNFCSNE